jgi:Zn finger protein HypA/HybF involved in hydrogenase expression
MKVIDKKEHVITCQSCDTVYQYDDTDLKLLNVNVFCVDCPNCGQRVIFVPDIKLKQKQEAIEIKGENDNAGSSI